MIVRAESGGVGAVVNRRNFRRLALPVIVGRGRRVLVAGMGDAAPTFSTPSGACTPTSCAGPYAHARDNYFVQFQVQSARPADQPAYVTQLETGQPLLTNGEFRAMFGYPWGQCSAWDAVCQACMQQAAVASDRLWTSTRGVWPRGTAVNWQCDTSQVGSPAGLPAQATTPGGSYIPSAQLNAGQVVFSGGNPLVVPTVPVAPAAAAALATATPASSAPPVGTPTVTAPAAGVQSNAPGAVVVGGGAAQSNAAGSGVALPASAAAAVASAGSFLTGSLVAGVPNWVFLAGGLLLFLRGGHK